MTASAFIRSYLGKWNEWLFNYGDRVLDKYSDGGDLLWSRVLEYGISSFQVDSADNLLLGGLEGFGVPVFLMVDSSGTVLWRRSLTGANGRVSGVAFASDGKTLATGYFYRSFTWAGTEFSYFGDRGNGGFLLAADFKGTPLWGHQLSGVVDFNSVPWVEVNRRDQIVVAFNDSATIQRVSLPRRLLAMSFRGRSSGLEESSQTVAPETLSFPGPWRSTETDEFQ